MAVTFKRLGLGDNEECDYLCRYKGRVPPYRKFTQGSAHAWNYFIILCIMIAWHMAIVFMKYFPFYLFSLLNYIILYYVTSENKGNPN